MSNNTSTVGTSPSGDPIVLIAQSLEAFGSTAIITASFIWLLKTLLNGIRSRLEEIYKQQAEHSFQLANNTQSFSASLLKIDSELEDVEEKISSLERQVSDIKAVSELTQLQIGQLDLEGVRKVAARSKVKQTTGK